MCRVPFGCRLLPYFMVALVATACIASSIEPDDIVLDVGQDGICLYGHWLSGTVTVRTDGCNVYIDDYLAYPSGLVLSEVEPSRECDEARSRKAVARFETIVRILKAPKLLIITPFSISSIGTRRHSDGFQAAIRIARESKTEISAESWPYAAEISASTAEFIRNPLSADKCRGY